MPHAFVAKSISVRVTGQHITRHILTQTPRPGIFAGTREPQLNRRQVARMVTAAWSDQERHKIAGLNRDIFNRTDFSFVASLRRAAGQSPSRGSAPQLEHPRDTVA